MRSRKGDSLTAPTVNPRAGTQAAASAIIVSGLSYRKRHSGSPEVALRTARCIIGATAEVKAASATQGLPRQVAQVTAKSRRQRPALARFRNVWEAHTPGRHLKALLNAEDAAVPYRTDASILQSLFPRIVLGPVSLQQAQTLMSGSAWTNCTVAWSCFGDLFRGFASKQDSDWFFRT